MDDLDRLKEEQERQRLAREAREGSNLQQNQAEGFSSFVEAGRKQHDKEHSLQHRRAQKVEEIRLVLKKHGLDSSSQLNATSEIEGIIWGS